MSANWRSERFRSPSNRFLQRSTTENATYPGTRQTPGRNGWLLLVDRVFAKADIALTARHHPGNAFEGGRAGTVTPEQRNQFTGSTRTSRLADVVLAVMGMAIYPFANHALPPVIMLPR
jgi:hypothetical protein